MPKSSRPSAGSRPSSMRPQQTETDRILRAYVSQDAGRRKSPVQGDRPESKRPSAKKAERKAQAQQPKRKSLKGEAARKSANAASNKNEVRKGSAIRSAQRRKDQAKQADSAMDKAGAPNGQAGWISKKPSKQPSVAVSRVLMAVIVVAILGLSGALLCLTPLFPVKEIAVEGASQLSDEEVVQIAAVPEGSTLLRVRTPEIEDRLESSPWIESAQVTREMPGTLKVTIDECEAAALVEITSKDTNRKELWAIDADGKWIMQIPDEGSDEAEGVPASVYSGMEDLYTITDVPVGPAPVAGAECTDAPVLNALQIIDGLSTELKDQVVSVEATGNHDTTLILEDGVEISFGDAADIRTKERICLKLLEENEGWISTINVRVVDRPTWRSY